MSLKLQSARERLENLLQIVHVEAQSHVFGSPRPKCGIKFTSNFNQEEKSNSPVFAEAVAPVETQCC